MCFRMREAGWTICRIDAEMTLHDAAMTKVGQWWQRARRAGHAYAEGAALHGSTPRRYKVTETHRALFWGAVLPAAGLLGAVLLGLWWLLLPVLGWTVQVARLVVLR